MGDKDKEICGSEIKPRRRWLVAGVEDGQVSVRESMDLTKSNP